MQALSVTQPMTFSPLAPSIFFQMGEKVKGLCLHEDCLLACSVALGSDFGLAADAEEKMEKKLFPLFNSGFMLI